MTTSFPRVEAHSHAHGEPPHATIIHVGVATGHDHHAGHDHALDQPHDLHAQPHAGSAPSASEVLQHLHLLPQVLALPASVTALPVVHSVPIAVRPRTVISPVSRPEELFRPPIC